MFNLFMSLYIYQSTLPLALEWQVFMVQLNICKLTKGLKWKPTNQPISQFLAFVVQIYPVLWPKRATKFTKGNKGRVSRKYKIISFQYIYRFSRRPTKFLEERYTTGYTRLQYSSSFFLIRKIISFKIRKISSFKICKIVSFKFRKVVFQLESDSTFVW